MVKGAGEGLGGEGLDYGRFFGVIVMRGREREGGFEMGSWEGMVRKEEFVRVWTRIVM